MYILAALYSHQFTGLCAVCVCVCVRVRVCVYVWLPSVTKQHVIVLIKLLKSYHACIATYIRSFVKTSCTNKVSMPHRELVVSFLKPAHQVLSLTSNFMQLLCRGYKIFSVMI